MAKKRLVFTLLYQDNNFYLSRNFRLQKVGGLSWLQNNYRFADIATSIDEMVIIDVSRGARDCNAFCAIADKVAANCFMPLALGGGISCLQDAEIMINSGADKIIVNTVLTENPGLVKELVQIYGSQCLVASVDYRYEAGSYVIYTRNGCRRVGSSLSSYVCNLMELRVGEIYLNSMDRDGTGQGYWMEALDQLPESCHLPVIMAGGAGNQNHLLLGLQHPKVDAVATANLFNFVGNGLPMARRHLLSQSANLAQW